MQPKAINPVILAPNRCKIMPAGKAKTNPMTAMMDISDGLSSEVLHICKQSGVGAVLYEDKIPVHPDAKEFAYKLEIDPTACALSGGEDYELLFTIHPSDAEKIKYLPEIYIAGEILEPQHGVKLQTKGGNLHDLKAQGWQHF